MMQLPTTQVVAITQTLAPVISLATARWMSTTCLTSSNSGATSATKSGRCLTKWNGSPLGGPFFFRPNEGMGHPFKCEEASAIGLEEGEEGQEVHGGYAAVSVQVKKTSWVIGHALVQLRTPCCTCAA